MIRFFDKRGNFKIKGMAIGSGGAAADSKYFIVSETSYIKTGESTKTIPEFIGFNIIFIRSGVLQTPLLTEPTNFSWNKTTGLFTFSPEAMEGDLFVIIPI